MYKSKQSVQFPGFELYGLFLSFYILHSEYRQSPIRRKHNGISDMIFSNNKHKENCQYTTTDIMSANQYINPKCDTLSHLLFSGTFQPLHCTLRVLYVRNMLCLYRIIQRKHFVYTLFLCAFFLSHFQDKNLLYYTYVSFFTSKNVIYDVAVCRKSLLKRVGFFVLKWYNKTG